MGMVDHTEPLRDITVARTWEGSPCYRPSNVSSWPLSGQPLPNNTVTALETGLSWQKLVSGTDTLQDLELSVNTENTFIFF